MARRCGSGRVGGAAGERLAGLGARHAHRRRPRRPARSSSAPTAPTPAPTARPTSLDLGGIPQGDYAPAPWLQSSARLRDLVRDVRERDALRPRRRRSRCRRARPPGRCALHVLADPSPARPPAPLPRPDRAARRCCPSGATGSGSRATSTRTRSDVEEDFHGYRWHGIPLDAIVLDSPWETQYNTWESNPHQFPDSAGMVARLRAAGVRTVVWVTPWVNLDSRDGQIPPDAALASACTAGPPELRRGRRAGHFVRGADGDAVRRALVDGHRLADRLHLGRRRGVVARAGAGGVLALGVEGIKADDGEGYYLPDDVRFADGTRGAEAAWALRRPVPALDAARARRGPPAGRGVVFGRSGWSGQQATGCCGAATRRPTSGRCGRSSPRTCARRTAASRTGRTTSAATSASALVDALPAASCCCAGCSSAASRR